MEKSTKTKKLPKLTKKQRGFVKDYIETGIGSLAVKKNYDVVDDATARSIASENLTKPNIVKSIQESLPDELLAKVHLEGLAATGIRFTPKGEQIKVEDFATRHKYLDSSYKLKGSYAAEKSISINAQVNIENKEHVEALALKVMEQMKKEEIV